MARRYEAFMSNSAAIAESATAVSTDTPTNTADTPDLVFVGGIQSPNGGWVAAGSFTSKDLAHILGR